MNTLLSMRLLPMKMGFYIPILSHLSEVKMGYGDLELFEFRDKTMKTILLTAMIILLTTPACAGFVRGPFSGKVIDAETKEPIESAVVLVVWNKAIYLSPG